VKVSFENKGTSCLIGPSIEGGLGSYKEIRKRNWKNIGNSYFFVLKKKGKDKEGGGECQARPKKKDLNPARAIKRGEKGLRNHEFRDRNKSVVLSGACRDRRCRHGKDWR